MKSSRRLSTRTLVLSALLLTTASVGAQPAADWGPLPSPPQVERLDNGLTLVTVPWSSPGIVAYYTLVRVGSRDEVEEGHSGFAHLFEHMMFRGTERFPEEEYERKVQSFGADNNAFTTRDYTLYTVTIPEQALDQLIELEADRFRNLKYSESQFRTETGAVLGEYNKSASSPFLKMWEALNEQAFEKHTYGHTTLGYLEDIKAMPGYYDYSLKFFQRFYTPDNVTLLVAGDFDREHLKTEILEHYGDWQGTRDQPTIAEEPPPSEGKRRHVDWQGNSEPRVVIGYRTPAFGGAPSAADLADVAALEVARGLAFSQSSPLVQRWVIEKQQALELGSWSEDFNRDPGLFVISASLASADVFDSLIEEVQRELDGMAEGNIDAARLSAVRSHLRYAKSMDVETPSDALEMLADFIAVSGTVQSLPAYLQALSQVTAEDVQRVAGKYLNAQRRFVVTLAPADEKEAKP